MLLLRRLDADLSLPVSQSESSSDGSSTAADYLQVEAILTPTPTPSSASSVVGLGVSSPTNEIILLHNDGWVSTAQVHQGVIAVFQRKAKLQPFDAPAISARGPIKLFFHETHVLVAGVDTYAIASLRSGTVQHHGTSSSLQVSTLSFVFVYSQLDEGVWAQVSQWYHGVVANTVLHTCEGVKVLHSADITSHVHALHRHGPVSIDLPVRLPLCLHLIGPDGRCFRLTWRCWRHIRHACIHSCVWLPPSTKTHKQASPLSAFVLSWPSSSNMYSRMFVCTYECLYLCMYVCMDGCMHACMYVCMYVCMYACNAWHCACMYACICVSL